jgi:antibiotic biosynthesis monooxygenase (ABM) superfamily enzyme
MTAKGDVPQSNPTDDLACLITGQRVREGHDDDYRRWQEELNAAAAGFPGFSGSEVRPPTGNQPEWIAVCRFDSVTHLQDWLNSATRLELIDKAKRWFDGPATAQVLAPGGRRPESLVTVVVTHQVAPDRTAEFLAWRKRIEDAQDAFPGSRGSELFRPAEATSNEWTVTYRFDSARNLDAWLDSPERKALLDDAEQFGDFTTRKIDHSFGNWFSFTGPNERPPSDFRTSVAVWLGLYPTVVFLTLLAYPLGMPLWLGLLVGNLLSSFVMTYLTMPYYVNPLLAWWLRPSVRQRRQGSALRGILLVLGVNAVWAVVFYFVTIRFWPLA